MSPDRRSVLVVDDDGSFRDLLRTVFQSRGFVVLAVENALEALGLAAGQPLDAVVTDYDMPHMTGLELCRMLRQRDAAIGRRVPVWIVTGAPDITNDQALAAGAERVFRKPCSILEILLAVEGHLARSRGEARAVGAPAPRAGEPVAPADA